LGISPASGCGFPITAASAAGVLEQERPISRHRATSAWPAPPNELKASIVSRVDGFVLRPRQAHADIANPEAPSTFTHRLRERVRHGRSNGLDLTARKLSGQASERIDLDAP